MTENQRLRAEVDALKCRVKELEFANKNHLAAIKAAVAALKADAELWRAVSASTMELWDGVEMRDAVTAWENEYRARLARGVTTDAEVKAHHAAIDQARGDGNG